MEIGNQEQEDIDFDWFCVDASGQLGHFTTAGFKKLPKSVARSAEDLKTASEYLETQVGNRGQHRISAVLEEEIPDPESRSERYLRSFIAMADKGLYSFDIASHLKPNISYFLVASPTNPLLLDELPEHIRAIVGRTMFADRLFKTAPRIPYEDTIAI